MTNRVSRLRDLSPVWVAEVGKIALGAGIGAWLAWAGAVEGSFSPRRLHYWAAPSQVATVVIVMGAIAWWVAAHPDPRIAEFQKENELLHGHLKDAHRVMLVSKSEGVSGPAGPPAGSSNVSAFPGVAVNATARASIGFTGHAAGAVELPTPNAEDSDD